MLLIGASGNQQTSTNYSNLDHFLFFIIAVIEAAAERIKQIH
jgi:hypothetical protein